MTTLTIQLAGPGTVPALPPELHPVAYTAEALPARTWGVVVCPDDGAPILETPDGVTQVAAGRLAAALTGSYGPGVYVVYRCPTAVTVHTVHVEHRGNTLGTLAVASAAGADSSRWGRKWRQILLLQRSAERDRLVLAAVRAAHRLPAGAPDGAVLLHALRNPLPDQAYVIAYIRLLGDRAALHEHAVANERRLHQHRRPRPRRRNAPAATRFQLSQ